MEGCKQLIDNFLLLYFSNIDFNKNLTVQRCFLFSESMSLWKITNLHYHFCFLSQLMPRTGSTFFTWPTTSYRTVKGKMPLFTAQRSLKFCVMLSCWSSESFVLHQGISTAVKMFRAVYLTLCFMFVFTQIQQKKILLLTHFFYLFFPLQPGW